MRHAFRQISMSISADWITMGTMILSFLELLTAISMLIGLPMNIGLSMRMNHTVTFRIFKMQVMTLGGISFSMQLNTMMYMKQQLRCNASLSMHVHWSYAMKICTYPPIEQINLRNSWMMLLMACRDGGPTRRWIYLMHKVVRLVVHFDGAILLILIHSIFL